jgi:NAD(P) transhydrogenase subunit alpha
MDALSSQAAAAGYKAALLAANALDKFLPMLTTAAGTIRPAQVLVIGAGVAGLQAIATSRRLGAIVEAYDVRAATKEQIQSLGAKFVDTGVAAEGTGGYARELTDLERAKQQAILDSHIAKADAVITTAAIPGRPAPRIVSAAAGEVRHAGTAKLLETTQ